MRAEVLGAEAPGLDGGGPMIGIEARLALELAHEAGRVRYLLPDLGQEDAAVLALLEDDAVDAGPQARRQVGFVAEGDGAKRAEDGDAELEPVDLGRRHRLEAAVVEGRPVGVVDHVRDQRPLGDDGADAAAQFATRLERDEGIFSIIRPTSQT